MKNYKLPKSRQQKPINVRFNGKEIFYAKEEKKTETERESIFHFFSRKHIIYKQSPFECGGIEYL